MLLDDGDLLRSLLHVSAALWAFRARAEADSAAMFRHLVSGLRAVDAHPETLRLAELAVVEEERHVELCQELVRHFGGVEEGVTGRPRATVRHTRESVLVEVVGMCCINETLSAATLTEMQKNTRGTAVHAIVTQILRDEVQHARIGWSHLAFESQRGAVDGVALRIQELVDAAVHGLGEEGPGLDSAEFLAAGGLGRSARLALLSETMEAVVLPGLRANGVPIGEVRLPN